MNPAASKTEEISGMGIILLLGKHFGIFMADLSIRLQIFVVGMFLFLIFCLRFDKGGNREE